ncbi:sialic acid-binding Ig-like lectin 15 isoform X2 [Phyllopteryx taeniolatus]|uniref:sialic acid-binding Ig-like lectin 15 isoform X2 n=1 Tax=Phyllopteryx taeniolatus TaxID=161469 RepID=UPI002AD4166E|nr:sialic acid-binding Ig-like lectin 15 isoform X2 [Phyllopteryx taeniolatus]
MVKKSSTLSLNNAVPVLNCSQCLHGFSTYRQTFLMYLETNQSLNTECEYFCTGSVSSSSLHVNVSDVVSVLRGQDAVLGCSFTHPKQDATSIMVSWTARLPTVRPFFQCVLKNDMPTAPTDCLGLDRFSLTRDLRKGELSLLIRGVEVNEDGVYFCHVVSDGGRMQRKELTLKVQVKPSILSLSLVNGSSSAPHRLQCVAEGKPLPNITWLSASGVRLASALPVQVQTSMAGLNLSSSVLYDEQQGELTCRVESVLGRAEQKYPPANMARRAALICGGVAGALLLLAVCGVVIHRLRLREAGPLHSSHNPDSSADEVQTVYAIVGFPEACEGVSSTHVHTQGQALLYSTVKLN